MKLISAYCFDTEFKKKIVIFVFDFLLASFKREGEEGGHSFRDT